MRFSRLILAALAATGTFGLYASPPIEFISAVRNAKGQALIEKSVKVNVDIASDPLASQILYSETHDATTGTDGLMRIMVGEGVSSQDFDGIDWSGRRYLRVQVDVEGNGMTSLGVMEFAGAPVAMQAHRTDALECTSPDGKPWRLQVNDKGELSWALLKSSYDPEKIPEVLYFIGTFNNWNVAEAIPMTKESTTRFSITRDLAVDEIFKFVPSQTWENEIDWSAVSCFVGQPNPMREFGNTEAFRSTPGKYKITVDFSTFTMTITAL